MTASIYLVRKHGKPVYVGFTRRPIKVRWNIHCNAAKRGSTYALHCAIRKYHTDTFTVECLYESEDIEQVRNRKKTYRRNESKIKSGKIKTSMSEVW